MSVDLHRQGMSSFHERLADQCAPEYNAALLIDAPGARSSAKDVSHEAVREQWAAHLARERTGEVPKHPLYLYVHIPFCNQVCSFCCYYVVAMTEAQRVDAYVDWLIGALEFHAPTFEGREFEAVYIGGGTPSILDERNMDRLLEAIFARFRFTSGAQKCVECNPDSVTEGKLSVMVRHGINRVSMGVQTFNTQSLLLENRGYQSIEMVERAVTAIHGAGLVLNLDLIKGLRSDDGRAFLDTLVRIMKLRPAEISIYPLAPTLQYSNTALRGTDTKTHFDKVSRRYEESAEAVREAIAEAGYTGFDAASLDDGRAVALHEARTSSTRMSAYADAFAWPTSVLGVGPTARSRITGVVSYSQDREIGSVFDPAKESLRARPVDARDGMLHYLLWKIFNDEAIPAAEFRGYFGRDLQAAFPGPLDEIAARGQLEVDAGSVRITGDKRQRFLAALTFFDPAELDPLLVTEYAVQTRTGPMRFRVSRVQPEQRYLRTAGDVGLVHVGRSSSFESDEHEMLLELFGGVFTKLGERLGPTSLRGFVDEFGKYLEVYLARMRKDGSFGELTIENKR